MDNSWIENGSLLIYSSSNEHIDYYFENVICLDLDNTLITTRSNNKFPKDKDDWKWMTYYGTNVNEILEGHLLLDYRIIIFTNQNGLKNESKKQEFKKKIELIGEDLNREFLLFASVKKDKYRKPSPFMYHYFINNYNEGKLPINVSYFGDAGGCLNDFSPSDRLFALNCGISYYKEDEIVLFSDKHEFDKSNYVYTKNGYNPKDFVNNVKFVFEPSHQPEIIILVGPPATGKSSFYQTHFEPLGYIDINQDKLKTRPNCLKKAKQLIPQNKSFVVDNTNPSPNVRREYLNLVKNRNYYKTCIYLNYPKEFVQHLNQYRCKIKDCEEIPTIAYSVYYKNFRKPDEEFDRIIEIKDFFPSFDKPEHKELFYQLSC